MAAIEVEAIVAGLSKRFQSHEVLIDGQRRGTMKGGETRLFEVAPGIHTIRLKLENHSSPSVKVVVGFGKTSVLCQTKAVRRFGLFSSPLPSTQIIVREDYDVPPQQAGRMAWQGADDRLPAGMAHALAD